MNFLFVALGGAIGSMCRYAISLIPSRSEFPVLTFITNIFGAVLIGFIVGALSDSENTSPNTLLFWKTGVCGGFTTFSTFSLEAFELIERKCFIMGITYMVLSVTFCVLGVLCGKKLALMTA